MYLNIKTYPSLHSTNTTLAAMGASATHGTVVRAVEQTAGRGQRGNTWESAPGANATFSIVLYPAGWPASGQFELSMIISLAIVRVLRSILGKDFPQPVKVKWPNDIYVADRKICGILIENTLSGNRIERMIAGIGININQKEFVSNAPNPVSLWQLTGTELDVEAIVRDVARAILDDTEQYIAAPDLRRLTVSYFSSLWRGDGHEYEWVDTATGKRFRAAITEVAPSGLITLRHADGLPHTYAFKEIQAIL